MGIVVKSRNWFSLRLAIMLIGSGLLGAYIIWAILLVTPEVVEHMNVPSDPYTAIHSVDFEKIGWHLKDYQQNSNIDTLRSILLTLNLIG
jgi:hypothetical protein